MRGDYSYPLRTSAERYADRAALIYADQRWSYRELDAATDRLAGAFHRRGLAGQRVVLLLRNEPNAVLCYLALARAGAVSVPANPQLMADELLFIVEDCGANAIIADAEFDQLARQLRSRAAHIEHLVTVNAPSTTADAEQLEDLLVESETGALPPVATSSPAMIVYTSGTSGFPKGVVRTHEANLWTCVNHTLGQARTPEDRELFVLPIFGIAFIFQVMPMILAGGTTILDGAFDPARTWDVLERHRVTRVFLAPTMLDSMLSVPGHERRDLSALRILNTAYEFPERVRRRAAERFGQIIAYMYGLTEAQLCCSTPAEFAADPSNAGQPMGMMRVQVLDEAHNALPCGEIGEIAMQGPSLMNEYYRRAEATAEVLVDGWLLTGDLGYLDEAGRVHIAGRKKEIIKSGGFSVDPIEVENVLLAYPGVREAAVVGVPDEHWGEQVVAFVSFEQDAAPPPAADVIAFLKAQLTSYKCPKQVRYIAELPKNPTGKVHRARLRAQASAHETQSADMIGHN